MTCINYDDCDGGYELEPDDYDENDDRTEYEKLEDYKGY